ncbi:MAG TPA: S9 family peptidase [Thermoanaerobaculaceae bacterium]|nr:S9 family peptidase [Thermoanaerobaculaceae bacterium]
MLRLLSLAILCGVTAGTVVAADTHPFTVHDMLAMARISEPRVSPDGRLVVFSASTTNLEKNKRDSHLWLAAADGAWVKQLTTSPARDMQPRWSPDGSWVYFVSTRSGSAQVWKIALDGGEAQQVTELPLDVDALEVAPGGKALVFGMAVFPGKSPEETQQALEAKEKSKASGMMFDHLFVRHWDTWEDGTRNHLFAFDLAARKAVDLMAKMTADCPTKPFGGSEDYGISPDGRTLVFSAKEMGSTPSAEAWSTNYDLFEVPLDGTAAPRRITTNPAWDAQPRFSPDGKALAYLAMTRPGYEADRFEVVVRELATGAERKFTVRVDDSPRGDRSPGSLAWSGNGTLLVTADDVGQSSVFAVDAATGKTRGVVRDGTCSDPQWAAGGRVVYAMNSLLGPTELYSVAADGKDARRITHLNDAAVAAARFGRPEKFSFTGAKGDTVHGYIVYPVDFDPARKYPVAFLIHGGPQGMFGNDFHYRWNPQAYAGAGYAAVMVDFRGSTGYGQAFTDAINDDWGGAPFEDLMKGLDFALANYPFLDKDRVGALGASYGGYMINWIAGHTDRFKCLVCHDGNLDERFAYYDTEELWFPEWEHRGTPWANAKGYDKVNPVDFVENWKTPMLVVHGMKDFRIPYSEGLATFTVLQRKGIPSKLLVFPDENHWVLKPANSILWHETVLGWLDQWLKKP